MTSSAQGRAASEPRRRLGSVLALLAAAALAASCVSSPEPAEPSAPPPAPPAPPSLADLISAGDQAGIRTFFSNQEQLNAPDAEGSYPLHRAVERGSAETVELLLVLGAKPEVKDAAGRSPLRLAVDKGSAPCVRVLADRGKVAVRVGPLIYNFESADQDLNKVLSPDVKLTTEFRPDLLNGALVVKGQFSDGSPLLGIPNFLRNNRPGRSIVWLRTNSD